MRPPEHPCPNHNNVRVPRAYGHQSIHAQTTITFLSQKHTFTRTSMPNNVRIPNYSNMVTRASKPKQQKLSCSKSIRSPEHPCQSRPGSAGGDKKQRSKLALRDQSTYAVLSLTKPATARPPATYAELRCASSPNKPSAQKLGSPPKLAFPIVKAAF